METQISQSEIISKAKINIRETFEDLTLEYLKENYYSIDYWSDNLIKEADEHIKNDLINDCENDFAGYDFINEDDFDSELAYQEAKKELIKFIRKLQS